MDRFFLEHSVQDDREPDDIQATHSDSDASQDEDEETRVPRGVKSVADAAGPWTQTPVNSGDWGRSASARGAPKRDFASKHTGPKGVRSDYKAHKHFQRQQRMIQEQERKMALHRMASGATAVPADVTTNQAEEESDDDDLLDDETLFQYNQARMQQMQAVAANRKKFGTLEYLDPEDFVRIAGGEQDGVVSIIHLYHGDNYACSLLNKHLETIASKFPCTRIGALVATDADATFAIKDLPILLVYDGSVLRDTVVDVSAQVSNEFSLEKITKYIQTLV